MREGFSIILPTIKAYKELNLCLESLFKHSKLENEIIIIVDRNRNGELNRNVKRIIDKYKISLLLTNKRNLGPYDSWNKGSQFARKDILCFVTDDQYFSPDWDILILPYLSQKRILTTQLIEPGVLFPSSGIIPSDFGDNARNFKEERFISFCKHRKEKGLSEGKFFIPLIIFKNQFFKIGMFPIKGRFGTKNTISNDITFIKKAKKSGFEFKTVKESFSYHFQASSWTRHRKLRKWWNHLRLLKKSLLQSDFLGKRRRRRFWGFLKK